MTLTRPTRRGVQRRWDRRAEKRVLHTIVLEAELTDSNTRPKTEPALYTHTHKHGTNGRV